MSLQDRSARRIIEGAVALFFLLSIAPSVPAQGLSADDHLVGLKAVGFVDPVEYQPDVENLIPQGPRGLTEGAGETRYFLVQLRGPAIPSVQRELTDAGARIVGYIRNNALVLDLSQGADEDRLRAAPAVRYVGPFLPAYKLDPALFRMLRDGEALGSASSTIDVELFPGENPDGLLQAVARHFAAGAVRPYYIRRAQNGRSSRLTFDVTGEALERAVGLFLHFSSVAYVRRLTPLEPYNDNLVWIGQSYDRLSGPGEAMAGDPKPYTESAPIWARGLFGAGQIVAVADTGLEFDSCFFDDPNITVVPQIVRPPAPLAVDPNHRKILALNGVNSFTLDHEGIFRHGSHVTAIVAGDDLLHPATGSSPGHDHGDGMAPDARIIFEDIGGFRNGACTASLYVDSVLDLLAQEYDAGARISTNSWGAGSDRPDEVDATVWSHEDFLVFFSAGNDGASAINELATNKNAIAVGATENYDAAFQDAFGILDPENMTAFSSRGPAADGRIKPDLVMPGYFVYSNRYATQHISDESDQQCSPGVPEIDVCFPTLGGCYLAFTDDACAVNALLGTSMATPAAAGLAALARQYLTEGFFPGGQARPEDSINPSAALLKALLINGASNMTGHLYERRGGNPQDFGPLADAPSAVQGWGRVQLDDALYFAGDARRLQLVDVANADGLATSESALLRFVLVSPDEPLKVTLTWTDPPAQSYALPALVNDLDLELMAPDGRVYRGNQWTADDVNIAGDKVSLPDPPGRDALNNVEGILIPSPEAGLYRLSIQAHDVPGYQGLFTQGYALVVTGAISTSPGAVPGGTEAPGPPLTIAKGKGTSIELTWSESCLAIAEDYEIYEGTLGDFGSHEPRFCSTGGATSKLFTPAAGDSYYLVVPRSADREGSYGTDSDGMPRSRSDSPCLDQELGPCLL
jgi:subtilisin family serine protease